MPRSRPSRVRCLGRLRSVYPAPCRLRQWIQFTRQCMEVLLEDFTNFLREDGPRMLRSSFGVLVSPEEHKKLDSYGFDSWLCNQVCPRFSRGVLQCSQTSYAFGCGVSTLCICKRVDRVVCGSVAVQGTAPFSQCKSSSHMLCCDFGVPCDCSQGSTASGQCEESLYALTASQSFA